MSNVKKFLLKKFPTNKYMDCPVPKSYWEIMQEFADTQCAPLDKRVKELEEGLREWLRVINRTPAALHHYQSAIDKTEQLLTNKTEEK